MDEIWRDIKGYEGLYQVSNLGRVKRLKSKYMKSERILKEGITTGGYRLVVLCKNNKSKTFRLHRLVAEAFIPNPENKPQVNHIDENKANNNVNNLEWMTAKENINHGTSLYKRSITQRKTQHSKRIIAIDIANGEYNYYCSISECARQLGLNKSHICQCLKGKVKQTGGYTFEYAE